MDRRTGIDGCGRQDFTLTYVSMAGRSNLFLWAKSWTDNDGSGLPDWWQIKYFGETGVDPYADPDGDGWSNIEEFKMVPTRPYSVLRLPPPGLP